LGSLFRYHTRLAALDWIMSAFGFAYRYLGHAGHSAASLALPSAIVCHCMFQWFKGVDPSGPISQTGTAGIGAI
jgi:hypothetical protein